MPSVAELYDRGLLVSAYVAASEIPYSRNYFRALLELMNKENRFEDFRILGGNLLSEKVANLILDKLGSPAATRSKPKSDNQRLKLYEQNLVKSGVGPSQVKSYVASLTLQSPECIGVAKLRSPKSMVTKLFWSLWERIETFPPMTFAHCRWQ